MSKQQAIDAICKAVWEMNKQAPHDFGGEQREFYLPRLNDAMIAVGVLFPAQFAAAVMADESNRPMALPSRQK